MAKNKKKRLNSFPQLILSIHSIFKYFSEKFFFFLLLNYAAYHRANFHDGYNDWLTKVVSRPASRQQQQQQQSEYSPLETVREIVWPVAAAAVVVASA